MMIGGMDNGKQSGNGSTGKSDSFSDTITQHVHNTEVEVVAWSTNMCDPNSALNSLSLI